MADVTLPQLGETVTEGTITKWFKKVGESVAADEPLFEVSRLKGMDTQAVSIAVRAARARVRGRKVMANTPEAGHRGCAADGLGIEGVSAPCAQT